jgi:phenylpropionate dioxygenase-like ring-hydroxylating dioxygenase large terminal subunit
MPRETSDLDALVEQNRVHRSVYTDPAIFDLEMERVFEKTWIYVGHASQIPDPGSFYTTIIGRQPVVMVRHKDGEIHVLYNRCGHKGAQLVAARCGVAKAFRCNYHGWRYDTDGTLLTIPLENGYDGTGFGRESADAQMRKLPRVGVYRGFVFASLSQDGPDLRTWLTGVDASIDNMVDRAPDGELEVAGGVLRYELNANWKFHVENLNDLLHAIVTHQSSSGTARTVGNRHFQDDAQRPAALQILSPFTNRYSFFDEMGVTVFPHGHSYSGGQLSIHSSYSDIPEYQARMEAVYGPERAREILSVHRHNTIIYPSLTLKGAIQTIRVVRPIAVDRTLLESWTFRLKGAPDELLRRSILYSTLVNSSAGMIQPDDHEAYIRMQGGLACRGSEWTSMHRHLNKDEPTTGGGRCALGTSDIVFRNQFATWKDLMRAGECQ